MKCSHCQTTVLVEPEENALYHDQDNSGMAYVLASGTCPACKRPMIWLRWGSYDEFSEDLESVHREDLLYPRFVERAVEPEVPSEIAMEFKEAAAVLTISPKASAAISRRLLQRILREQFQISRPSLAQEIDAFRQRGDIPTYLKDEVDAIRNIGNLAAHPLKDTNTGVVADVEPGEAEWLLEVLESLFDFAYVQPARLAARKQNLNAKLASLGKPPMKS